MLLLDRHGPKEDVWERAETLCQAETNFVLTPFGAIAESPLVQTDLRLAALLEPNRALDEVTPFFDRLDMIVVHFPSAADGRGFSTARQLRQAGFKGILRAFGPLISDQFPQALACGFDEVEIIGAAAARQPVEHWMEALKRISFLYQRDYGATDSIPEQRLARAAHV